MVFLFLTLVFNGAAEDECFKAYAQLGGGGESTPINLTYDSESRAWKMNGSGALRKQIVGGGNNEGIFFYEKNGQVRVIKIRRYKELDLQKRKRLAELDASGNGLAEEMGASKMLRWGQASVDGNENLYFFEFEHVFQGKEFSTVKLASLQPVLKVNNPMMDVPETAKKMARMYIEALENKIVPRDPDFAVSLSGEVRWIDGDQWIRYDHVDVLRNHLAKDIESIVRSMNPEFRLRFLTALQGRVKQSNLLSFEEKKVIEESLHSLVLR